MIYNTKRIWDKQRESVNVQPKWVVRTQLIPQDPRTCPGPLLTRACFMANPQWVRTPYNVCGLACMLGLTGSNHQVSLRALTTKECSTQ